MEEAFVVYDDRLSYMTKGSLCRCQWEIVFRFVADKIVRCLLNCYLTKSWLLDMKHLECLINQSASPEAIRNISASRFAFFCFTFTQLVLSAGFFKYFFCSEKMASDESLSLFDRRPISYIVRSHWTQAWDLAGTRRETLLEPGVRPCWRHAWDLAGARRHTLLEPDVTGPFSRF